ncbi:MAG: hypothetical protein GX496_09350, partial [Firmicutes bacterium]|nr:hypothetical protein [Bacillota bacterium]
GGPPRGGLGAVRIYQILKDDVHISFYSDRFKYPAEGLFGGHNGTCGYIRVIRKDGRIEQFDAKGQCVLNAGDVLEVGTGGGAGYGDPRERPRELVARDVRTGKVSLEAARRIYGWEGQP